MKPNIRIAFLLILIVCTLGILLVGNLSFAQNAKTLGEKLDEIADAIQKGNIKDAEKKAEALAKDQKEVYYVMMLLKPRIKKGLGVGPQAGAIQPDGIEEKIRDLAKKPLLPGQLKMEADALVQMAYRSAAVAKFAQYLPPKKKPEVWNRTSEGMYQSSLDLIKEIKAGNTGTVQMQAEKLNTICNSCHSDFR